MFDRSGSDPNEFAAFGEATNEIAAFRALTEGNNFPLEDRTALVDQALLLIDRIFVHLMHKRAMYAIDPRQRLRLLRFRASRMSDAEFHAELLRIFVELRDLHTNYILPRPYRGPVAFLGVLLEQYWEDDEPHWMVSKVYDQITGVTDLRPGCEVVYWNGAPVELAVARNADREPGSNPAARTARGLERMTLRKLALSPVPDEDWVDLVYRAGDGALRQTRLPWRILGPADLEARAPGIDTADDAALDGEFEGLPVAQTLAVDLRTEAVRLLKKQLFVPSAKKAEEQRAAGSDTAPEPTQSQIDAGELPTTRPDELRARRVPTPDGDYGHLRIYTFFIEDGNVRAFVDEVRRLVQLLPQHGLIIDVRGNGGGHIVAAEYLLQYFSRKRVQPERLQLINSDGTLALCRAVEQLNPWAQSIADSVETGAQYSDAIPLWSEDAINEVGRIYDGPVILITDALCYSATDMFAAGFQDHEIGTVLGTDETTGAGPTGS
jgi:hypothetical protein